MGERRGVTPPVRVITGRLTPGRSRFAPGRIGRRDRLNGTETAMRSPCRVSFLAATAILVLVGPPPLMAAPKEVTKLHALLVFDTADDALSDSLEIDESRVFSLLTNKIPQDRVSITVLKGKQVTPARILDHYRRAKPKAEDGLLFFYGGHGATDPDKKQHYFQLACGENLLRSSVRTAMESKKTALVVLLSDCCSTPQKIATVKTRKIQSPRSVKQIHPTLRCLLFKSRGTVDVTAATDAPSWSDNLEGGLFTRALCKMMTKDVKSLDADGDGLVTWREFFPRLQEETEGIFKTWSVDMKARGARIDTKTQKPSSFDLGAGEPVAYAVVGIENGTTRTIAYRFRWKGEQEWNEASMATGEKKVHFLAVKGGQEALPDLEIEINGRTMPARKAGKWTGEGKPSFDDGLSYRLGPRKK
jgi:hypothetical protein